MSQIASPKQSRGSAAGNIITVILLLGLIWARRLSMARQEGRRGSCEHDTERRIGCNAGNVR